MAWFLAAFCISLALVGQIMWAVFDENEGQHVQDVANSDIEVIAKSLLVGEILWSLVATLTRIATLVMLRKIFRVLSSCQYGTSILLGLVVIHGVGCVLATLCICRPIRANWDHTAGYCGNQIEAYVAFEVSGLVLDLILAIFPLNWIFRLQMDLRKKFTVSVIFSVGSLVSIITGLRISALDMVDTLDFTYNQAYLGLLSTLGALISVMLGCANSIPVMLNLCRGATRNHKSKCSLQVVPRQRNQLTEMEEGKDYIEKKENEVNIQETE
ncbi:hypothetical protein PG993_008546 [Apiospora rasikravindrae]|uniref:Rhodopsin domain-containing protein n=1 Tax=Apiospora rasikravindrae TaxID=990691 RepID=A0ABR1T0N7_9PEZI